jgi:hypothetical protein
MVCNLGWPLCALGDREADVGVVAREREQQSCLQAGRMVGMDCTDCSMGMGCMQQLVERIDRRDSRCIERPGEGCTE